MSESVPDRTVSGLPPRKRPAASAAALVRENRALTAEPAAQEPAREPEPSREPAAPRAAASKPRVSQKKKRAPGRSKVQIAVDVREDVRAQARAAFRAAAYFERVPTFSQFVENAIAAEIERIEKAYNDGKRMEPITENLPSGRPSGS